MEKYHGGFRVSSEESEQINKAVQLSGLSMQDYITRRLLCHDMIVQGNSRVYKALHNEPAAVLAELQRIEAGGGVGDELLDTIELIAVILGGLKGEDGMEDKKEMTTPNVSVGADTEQPIQKYTDNSISDYEENIEGKIWDYEKTHHRRKNRYHLYTLRRLLLARHRIIRRRRNKTYRIMGTKAFALP